MVLFLSNGTRTSSLVLIIDLERFLEAMTAWAKTEMKTAGKLKLHGTVCCLNKAEQSTPY